MNNVLSQFTLYEVLRIIFPGFYIVSMSKVIKEIIFPNLSLGLSSFESIVIGTVLSVFIGGFIYSLDIPRLIKSSLKDLPTNRIKEEIPKDFIGTKGREGETNYYNYYFNCNSAANIKTEIQSGFYHLFINFSVIGLFFSPIFLILSISKDYERPLSFFYLNIFFFLFGIISAITIYKIRLRHSWRRDFENFKNISKKIK